MDIQYLDSNDANSSVYTLLYLQSEYSYLVSGSRDRTVKLWDPLKSVCLMTFTVHDSWVRGVLIHPSGKYVISCSDDKSIRVLDVKVRTFVYVYVFVHVAYVWV
ncbi:hypothetical protein EON65_01060 [archaeon]|nr:MAG: hypothetical protein EON65_01060 [archaeon]